MLVGYRRGVDEEKVAGANAAREQKWASMQALKSREVGVKEADAVSKGIEAEASMGRAVSDVSNSMTASRAALETARHNVATEGLESTKVKGDIAYQTGTLANEKTKTAQQGLKLAHEAPLLSAQASQANAQAQVDTEKANLVKSGLQLRQTYLDPTTSDEKRGTITSMYQAEQGVKPRDTTTVLPGQKISALENGRIIEKVTNPLVVDEASSTSREVKPAQDFAKETPDTIKRLLEGVGTPRQKEYEDEYVKTFGKLPKGYTGK